MLFSLAGPYHICVPAGLFLYGWGWECCIWDWGWRSSFISSSIGAHHHKMQPSTASHLQECKKTTVPHGCML